MVDDVAQRPSLQLTTGSRSQTCRENRSTFGDVTFVGARSWLWGLLNGATMVGTVLASIAAWRSAAGVVRENRRWTRASRILPVWVAISVGGVWLPFGSGFVLAKYHRFVRSPARPAR
jgi:hypothetical protein